MYTYQTINTAQSLHNDNDRIPGYYFSFFFFRQKHVLIQLKTWFFGSDLDNTIANQQRRLSLVARFEQLGALFSASHNTCLLFVSQ